MNGLHVQHHHPSRCSKKKRRNCRKNGGAKVWAAACDELHAITTDGVFAPGAFVWAKTYTGIWWPACVLALEDLSVNLRQKPESSIRVKYYGKDTIALVEAEDVVSYAGSSDEFCQQSIPEQEADRFCAALAELQESRRARNISKEGNGEKTEEMGKVSTSPSLVDDNRTTQVTSDVAREGSRKRKLGSNVLEGNDPNKPGEEEGSRKRILKLRIVKPAPPQEVQEIEDKVKKLGSDGSYSECMVCDGGGSLLCCDQCPRVYHLHCLRPPIKRAPVGKWLCPFCSIKAIQSGEAQEKASCNVAGDDDKQASNGDSCTRNTDEMIKRFKKKPKLDENEEATKVDKCPPCGLNKQSSETFLDPDSPFGLLYEEEEMNSTPAEKKLPVCEYCGDHGSLVKCDRCSMSFHLACLETPLKKMPKGRWTCSSCSERPETKKRKLDQLLPPADPPEVDRIVGCRLQTVAASSEPPVDENAPPLSQQADQSTDVSPDLDKEEKQPSSEHQNSQDGATGKAETEEQNRAGSQTSEGVGIEYLVKWLGRSHVHNEWVAELRLKTLAKRKLENYKAKHGTVPKVLVDDKWTQPQKVIARRKGQNGEEVLVKWYGLAYDECTWERVDSSISGLEDLLATFDLFEKEAAANHSERNLKEEPGELDVLSDQPAELQGGLLFPHQLEALNWLRKCWHKKKNVILADEMGLGKTISACAFLSSLHHEFKIRGPCLVLVPLSTMPNWLAEFSLWAPGLNVIEYHGSVKARAVIRQYEWHPAGSKKQRIYKFKVMLTNYETVINDPGPLKSLPWEVLVVDEGHRLKNSGSKLFNLLNTFSFAHRVLMTGTPMQNNLGEMYNLLNFLLPEKFPSLAAFQEKFSALSTAEQVEEIRKLVSPHMLRRLKKDAMQGIPPKAERVVLVELSAVQSEYYRALLTKNYQLLRQGTKNQQSMINIIMQLRKVCNHPYLIPGTEPDSGTLEFLHEMRIKASAKLTLLHNMLGSLKEQNHRVLIFSQMTKLLDILEDYLTYEFGQESFERVDGSVPVAERQAAIRRFNKDKSRFVFLLSTRSCGLGINLATADTVIIYDSDFNPHADIQAMNRAHRIGQSKKLLVYRLVVRGSVEERILHLAKKKLELEQLFASKAGSQKEIEDILQWGADQLFEEQPEPEKASSEARQEAENDGKAKRKVGGLGDVYNDKCHESGRSKVIWDEAAVRRLLDRSSVPENAEGEAEGDMLGSIKGWECGEPEQEDNEQSMEQNPKDTVKTKSEGDNKWERLLRTRWEKLQTEEEAVLGRGKRQRKIISYSECHVQKSKDISSESEEVEDPEPEYTPAGHALKLKLARLRARQKERIALRYVFPPHIEGSEPGQPFLPPRVFQDALAELKRSGFPVRGAPEFPFDLSRAPDQLHRNLLPSVTATSEAMRAFPFPEPVDEALMQKALASRLSKDKAPDLNLFPGSLPPSLPDGVNPATGLRNLLPRTTAGGFLSQGLPVHFENPSRSFLHGPFSQSSSKMERIESVPGEQVPMKPVDLNKDADVSMFEKEPPAKAPASDLAASRLAKLVPGLSMSLALGNPASAEDGLPYGLPDRYRYIDGGNESKLVGRSKECHPWSGDELDALWTGVRRHGRGSWMNMLQDPKLCFSKRRTAVDLAERWEVEQAKLLGESVPVPGAYKEKKDRRRRSEHGKLPAFEFRNKARGGKGLPTGSRLLPNFADFNFPSRQDRGGPGRLNFPERPELPSHLNSVLQKLQDDPSLHGLPLLPSFNLTSDMSNPENSEIMPPFMVKKTSSAQTARKSSDLPHWLKEAFTVAPSPEPALSPHVAAVSQAVSILHKNQKSLLGSWTQLWHPLVPPRELPRRKKKRRRASGEGEALRHNRATAPPFSSVQPASGTHFPLVHLPPFSFSRSLLDPLSFPPAPLVAAPTDPTDPKHRAAPFFPELFPSSLPPVPSFRSRYLDGSVPGAIKQEFSQFLPSTSFHQLPQQPQQQPSFGSTRQRSKERSKTVSPPPPPPPPPLQPLPSLPLPVPPVLPPPPPTKTTTITTTIATATNNVELPAWMVPSSKPCSEPLAAPAAKGGATGEEDDSSSETHSDPEVRNKGESGDASSEGTVSDEEIQKL